MTTAAEGELVNGWWASDEGDGSQTVFLYRKESGAQSLLDRYTIDPYSMPTLEDFQFAIKEQHGGGIYEATVRTPTGQLVKRIPFSLAGLPKRQAEPAAAPAPAAPAAENGTDKLIAMMLENQRRADERLLLVLEKMSEQQRQEQPDPLVMVERVAGLLGKTGATPTPPKSLLEQVKELKEGAELLGLTGVGKGGDGSDGWGAMTALAGPLMDVVKENTVNERLKLQLAVDQQKRQAGQPAQPAQIAAPAQAPAAPAQFAALLAGFAPVLPQLVQAAQGGHPADMVAGSLMQIVPVTDRTALRAFLDREEALADMTALAPEIARHHEWFTDLANGLIELIDGGGNAAGTVQKTANPAAKPETENTRRPAGNAENAGNHGRPGTPGQRKPRNPGAGAGANVRSATEGLPQ